MGVDCCARVAGGTGCRDAGNRRGRPLGPQREPYHEEMACQLHILVRSAHSTDHAMMFKFRISASVPDKDLRI